MFQFMRKTEKDREKEKKHVKPDKTDKSSSLGKKVKDKLSPEDLHRLDEIRRSFKLGGKGKKDKAKLPSGIIADYSENFMSPLLSVTSPLKSPDGDLDGFPPISNSDSSESSLSSTSVSLKESAPGPVAKPPRGPVSSGRTPPPIPSRKPPSTRYSSEVSVSDFNLGAGLSRPPTSASSSSFTPSYITPPQSPSHKSLNLSKFYCIPELDLSDKFLPHVLSKRGLLRTLSVERQPSGDFGFSLRRASITLKVVSNIITVQSCGFYDTGSKRHFTVRHCVVDIEKQTTVGRQTFRSTLFVDRNFVVHASSKDISLKDITLNLLRRRTMR